MEMEEYSNIAGHAAKVAIAGGYQGANLRALHALDSTPPNPNVELVAGNEEHDTAFRLRRSSHQLD
jgi:hypothetical protein